MTRLFPHSRSFARAVHGLAGLALGALPFAAPAPAASPNDGKDAATEAASQAKASTGEDESPIVELDEPKWLKHTVVAGETLRQIADRYEVDKNKLIRWNKLDKRKPLIVAGHKLAVYTKHVPPPKRKLVYTLERGDTWSGIAKRYHVDTELLRERWNPRVGKNDFRPGNEIVIWVDPLDDPRWLPKPVHPKSKDGSQSGAEGALADGEHGEAAGDPLAAELASLPLVAIPSGSISVGKTNKGKLVNAVALPPNPQLYTIRKPDEAYGSSFALSQLQLAIARWRRDSGYTGALKIGAISKKGGGKLRPHSSHRSGRDVDIRLPLKAKGDEASKVSDVDWDALWALVVALIDTGAVKTIYLTTDRQKHLAAAAKRAGADKDTRTRILQYPEGRGHKNGIVRHSPGHTAHMHVRFVCADNETRCEE